MAWGALHQAVRMPALCYAGIRPSSSTMYCSTLSPTPTHPPTHPPTHLPACPPAGTPTLIQEQRHVILLWVHASPRLRTQPLPAPAASRHQPSSTALPSLPYTESWASSKRASARQRPTQASLCCQHWHGCRGCRYARGPAVCRTAHPLTCRSSSRVCRGGATGGQREVTGAAAAAAGQLQQPNQHSSEVCTLALCCPEVSGSSSADPGFEPAQRGAPLASDTQRMAAARSLPEPAVVSAGLVYGKPGPAAARHCAARRSLVPPTPPRRLLRCCHGAPWCA